MNIEVLCEHPNNANTYIISDLNNVIIIDPANDIRSIKTLIKDKKVCAILLTHGHYDHFKTLLKVLKEYNVICYMHKNAKSKLENVDLSCARLFGCNIPFNIDNNLVKYVGEGTMIEIENFKIKSFYKPGHTDCSVIYQIEDNLFTGDFLFEGSIGRCDLPTGNLVVMKKSLEEIKQFGKRSDVYIYPGHGDKTTLFNELKTNYYLLRN